MPGYAFKFHEPAAKSVAEPICTPMPPAPLLSQPLTQTRFALLDTESTGPDPEKDKVIEVAARLWFLDPNHKAPYIFESFVDPGCKIPPSSMAVHHITDAKIAGAPQLSETLPDLLRLIDDAIPVAYNAEYDRKMLRGTPLHDRYWLDLYRLAMKTWHIGEFNADGFALTSFKQQELRYWLGVRDTPGEAHRAAADIFVSGLVFQAAVGKFLGGGMVDDASTFLSWVEAPIVHKTIPFGPNAGLLPEQLEDYQLRNCFDVSKPIYESYARFNVLDFLRPEMIRRSLSENMAPRARGPGVKR